LPGSCLIASLFSWKISLFPIFCNEKGEVQGQAPRRFCFEIRDNKKAVTKNRSKKSSKENAKKTG
jgi:hypothetical protein